jgi:HD-like signal output (HDOD) protein
MTPAKKMRAFGKIRSNFGPTARYGFIVSTLSPPRARFRTRPLDQIVPVSPVAAKLLQMPVGRGVPFQVYADVISRDPAFAAQDLAMANSPLLGLRTPVATILQALCVLGQDRLNALIAMLAFYRLVVQTTPAPVYRAYWRHSVATAVLTERLVAAYADPVGHEYPAALLHNIGALVILREDPPFYEELLASAASCQDVLEREREAVGENHAQLGSRLVRAWQLPEPFQEAAANHVAHAAPPSPASELSHWVAAASSLAAAAGFGFGPVEMPADLLKGFAANELMEGLDERINAIECSLGA